MRDLIEASLMQQLNNLTTSSFSPKILTTKLIYQIKTFKLFIVNVEYENTN